MTSLKGRWRIMCALAVSSGVIGACAPADISREPLFADMVGRQYRIVGEVDAYGVRAELQDKEATFIALIPLGIRGPEIVFRKRMPIGQTFRILSAKRRFILLEKGIEYVVELQNSELPRGIEIRLGLSGGNESGDVDLNPRLYERVVKDQ